MASCMSSPSLSGLQRPRIKSNILPLFQIRNINPNPNPSFKKPLFCVTSPNLSLSSSSEREEIRWLREEQRWLREEHRWNREESRWRTGRDSLLREIATLRLRVDALELRKPSPAAAGASVGRIGARAVLVEEADVKEMILDEFTVLGEITLSGEEVRAMQDGSNGAPIASVSESAGIKQAVRKGSGNAQVDVSSQRVFLLGENRWEDPSRLISSNKSINGSKVVSPTECLTCRGEGQILCIECDGGGEANIEPQFTEWMDNGANCPYCEGLGYTICDACEGNVIAAALII